MIDNPLDLCYNSSIRKRVVFLVNDFRLEARCVTLVERMLKEERSTLHWLQEHGKTTNLTEYNIARLEYALGERETPPSLKEFGLRKEY